MLRRSVPRRRTMATNGPARVVISGVWRAARGARAAHAAVTVLPCRRVAARRTPQPGVRVGSSVRRRSRSCKRRDDKVFLWRIHPSEASSVQYGTHFIFLRALSKIVAPYDTPTGVWLLGWSRGGFRRDLKPGRPCWGFVCWRLFFGSICASLRTICAHQQIPGPYLCGDQRYQRPRYSQYLKGT